MDDDNARVPRKGDKLFVFMSDPFSEPSHKTWVEAFIVSKGDQVTQRRKQSDANSGTHSGEKENEDAFVLGFEHMASLNAPKANNRGPYGVYARARLQAIQLKHGLFRDGTASDIQNKSGCEFRWGFRGDIRFSLQVQIFRGINKCHFLKNESSGKLIRMPASKDQMLVLGRQHCNNDQQVSRCAASINFDTSDGTWKLRFTGTNTGL